MSDDGFLNVFLPDAYGTNAIIRNALVINQTLADGKGTDCRGQVAAVTGPVDKSTVNRHLTEQVINVVIVLLAFRQNHSLGGTGGRTAHPINLLTIRIRTANGTQQDFIPCFTWYLSLYRQIDQVKEHPFRSATTHVSRGDFNLWFVSHSYSLVAH